MTRILVEHPSIEAEIQPKFFKRLVIANLDKREEWEWQKQGVLCGQLLFSALHVSDDKVIERERERESERRNLHFTLYETTKMPIFFSECRTGDPLEGEIEQMYAFPKNCENAILSLSQFISSRARELYHKMTSLTLSVSILQRETDCPIESFHMSGKLTEWQCFTARTLGPTNNNPWRNARNACGRCHHPRAAFSAHFTEFRTERFALDTRSNDYSHLRVRTPLSTHQLETAFNRFNSAAGRLSGAVRLFDEDGHVDPSF